MVTKIPKEKSDSNPVDLAPALSLKIGTAMVLSRLALQEINEANAEGFDTAFAESNITPDNFVCLLVGLRDTLEDVCELASMPL